MKSPSYPQQVPVLEAYCSAELSANSHSKAIMTHREGGLFTDTDPSVRLQGDEKVLFSAHTHKLTQENEWMTSRRARDSFNLLPSVFLPRDSFLSFFLLRLHSSTLLQSFPIIVWSFFLYINFFLFLSFRLAREHFEAGNYDIYIILSLILIFSFFPSPPPVGKCACVCMSFG